MRLFEAKFLVQFWHIFQVQVAALVTHLSTASSLARTSQAEPFCFCREACRGTAQGYHE